MKAMMKSSDGYPMRRLVAACALALAVCATSGAQQANTQQPATTAPQPADPFQSSNKLLLAPAPPKPAAAKPSNTMQPSPQPTPAKGAPDPFRNTLQLSPDPASKPAAAIPQRPVNAPPAATTPPPAPRAATQPNRAGDAQPAVISPILTEGKAPATEIATNAQPSAPGNHTAIQVHGYWKIDVLNPDRTPVQHQEFENSLVQPDGPTLLFELLRGQWAPGGFAIRLYGNVSQIPSNSPCYAASSFSCFITGSPSVGQRDSNECVPGTCSTNLTTTYYYGTPNSNGTTTNLSITLSGSIAANQNGSIITVNTLMGFCSPSANYYGNGHPDADTLPDDCAAGTGSNYSADTPGMWQFTSYTLPSPMPILNGQIVQVTVTLSFS